MCLLVVGPCETHELSCSSPLLDILMLLLSVFVTVSVSFPGQQFGFSIRSIFPSEG